MTKTMFVKLMIGCLVWVIILSGCGTKDLLPTKNKPVESGYQAASSNESIKEQLVKQSQVKKFNNYDELKEFLENNMGSGYDGDLGFGMTRNTAVADFGMDAMEDKIGLSAPLSATIPQSAMKAMESSESAGHEGSADYSQTNVQVEGVDEADIVKTDGKYIYAVVNQDLFVIDAYPAKNAEVISKISFESRPDDIYINGDYLIVYGYDTNIFQTDLAKLLPRRSQYNFFKVFNVSNHKTPKQVRDLNFEGYISNSRMISDYVYLTISSPAYYDDVVPLPRIIENGELLSIDPNDVKCNCPEVYYFDIPYSDYNFTSVMAINVVDNKEVISNEVYLMAGNQNLYVSQNNIYITYTRYISEYQIQMEVVRELVYPRLSIDDQNKINKIEAVENYILSPNEKTNKVMQIIERFASNLSEEERNNLEDESENKLKEKYEDISKELEKTIIHKINIDGKTIAYQTNGEVTGQVLNQFSMDENDGYLRIATTKSREWSRFEENTQESYNNLYILDKNLKLTGSIEGLAEGERIYSVRFMQGRAYMVTFRQTDPLFVIDVKDPRNPRVLGELKIPGFSNYLHPYDENLLIGFGKDAGESEWGGVQTKGLKLSLFDVSSMGNPKEVDTYILGDMGSDSIALYDHKAFLFSKDKNLLSIPVSIQESVGDNRWGRLTFSGAAVFHVDENGFKLNGKIDHSDGGRPSSSEYWQGVNYYDNTVKRSLYIDNVLYTFSSQYIKMNDLNNDLKEVNNLRLKKEKSGSEDDFEVIN